MTFSFKKNKMPGNATTANVVDNHLILSLPKAKNPVIWRMELKKTGSVAFEVKENDKNTYLLQIKQGKSTPETVAPFDTKENAVEALMIASQALQNAPAQAQQNKQAPTSKKNQNSKNAANNNQSGTKWILILMSTILIIALFVYLSSLIPTETTLNAQRTSTTKKLSPQKKTGVPVSADDFLSGR